MSLIRAKQKIFSDIKWTDIEYHVQDDADVAQKYVKIYYNKNQFKSLSFCSPHSKPHSARRLSNHYNLRFGPKLGNGVCAIRFILSSGVACNTMIDKPWISSIP